MGVVVVISRVVRSALYRISKAFPGVAPRGLRHGDIVLFAVFLVFDRKSVRDRGADVRDLLFCFTGVPEGIGMCFEGLIGLFVTKFKVQSVSNYLRATRGSSTSCSA